MKRILLVCLALFVTIVSLKAQENTDSLIMKNGVEVPVLISEVGVDYVKYRKLSMPDGPDYVVPKSDLLLIKYRDGSKEVMGETTSAPMYEKPHVPVRFQGYITADLNTSLSSFGGHTPAINVSMGVKASDYFYAGLQTGLGCMIIPQIETAFVTIPFGVDLKGLLPVGSKTNMFLGFDIGAYLLVAGDGTAATFYTGPYLGVETGRFVASLGYQAAGFHCLNLRLGVRLGKPSYRKK